MSTLERTNGTPWSAAISTAKFTGVRLRDLLLAAGFDEEAYYRAQEQGQGGGGDGGGGSDSSGRIHSSQVRHVVFVGADGMQASVPLRKALSREHGAPLRVVVPGHAGVRNVKWVTEIRLSREEAEGPWQRGMSYKGFGPSVRQVGDLDIESIPSLQEQPVTSAITLPQKGAALPLGETLEVSGYAYSGGGRGIVRVDVSADGGKTWQCADLGEGSQQPLDRAWAWTFWQTEFDNAGVEQGLGGTVEIISKATDAAHNTQPDTVQ
ncbi:Mo-co oxidoreductase dimerization domain-containing protein, partial [Ochromonadaceae sp. CCMP2298]